MNKFQRLLSALILYSHNVRILHWKVKGVDFDTVHALFGDYQGKLDGLVDDIAEIGLQLDIQPVSLRVAIETLENDNDFDYLMLEGDESFSSFSAFEKISGMFKVLIDLYEDLCCDDNVPADVANKMQEHTYWLRKELQYKNRQRLT